MADINSVITNELNGLDAKETRLSVLKDKIRPYATPSELKEVLDDIIAEDGDYIRRYLVNSCNIIYQKDFVIDVKDKFIYKSTFNNDSTEITFNKDKVLLIINDYTLHSHHHNFMLDIFVNGRKLPNDKYIDMPSAKKYNFQTGMRRIFINEAEINSGDLISVVVKKAKKIQRFFRNFHIYNNSITKYGFYKREVGEYNGDTDNLLVYKKLRGENSFSILEQDFYCIIEDGESLYLNILEKVFVDDSYVVINKLWVEEVTFTNDSELTLEEYLEEVALMTIDLVNPKYMVEGCPLPIPVRNAKEVEIYIDGLKLVPDVDFQLVSVAGKNQYLQLSGILKQDSIVTIRNRNLSKLYGFYDFNQSILSEGIVSLRKYMMPISESYVEAYIGRRRISKSHLRTIANTMLKVDNQKTLKNLEIFTEIDYDTMVYQLLSKYNESKPTMTQLSDTFTSQVIDSWKENNELLPNTNAMDAIYNDSEVFLGKINRIELLAYPTVIQQGKKPEFVVTGYYSDTEVGIDITNVCTFSTYNKYQIGKQTVMAYYNQGIHQYTDSIEIDVIDKNVTELKIVSDTNFFVIGDKIRDSIRVLAKYEDNSEKFVTEDCVIEAPEYATEAGGIVITASLEYNNQYISTQKSLLISETSDRKISKTEVLLDNYVSDGGESYSKINVFVTYNNNLIQHIDLDNVSIFTTNTNGEFTVPIEGGEAIFPLDKTVKLKVDVYTNSNKTTLVEYEDPSKAIVEIRVLKNVITDENRVVVYDNSIVYLSRDYVPQSTYAFYRVKSVLNGNYITVGENELGNDAICFATVSNNELVIVEFLNTERVVVSQELFLTRNINYYKEKIYGNLNGSAIEGYTVQVNKFILGKELSDIDLENISLLDSEGSVVTTFKPDIDMVTESETTIYFHFQDFSTKEGNVLAISEFFFTNKEETDVLSIDIINTDKVIELSRPVQDINKVGTSSIIFDRTKDDHYLILTPNIPRYSNVVNLYEVRPLNKNITELTVSSEINIPVNSNGDILYGENRYGITRYYFVVATEDRGNVLYSLEVSIGYTNGRVRVLSINGDNISEAEYLRIQERK